jgi:putative membrane protein
MLRAYLGVAFILVLVGFIGAAQNAKDAKEKTGKKQEAKKQEATITKLDAKKGTVTVRMKDKNGKDVERAFKVTDDIQYFDSTGNAVAIDIFRSGDDVLVVEAQGRLREIHRGGSETATAGKDEKDRDFLKTAAEIDIAEIKLGHLAMERGSASALKKYGERLIADHAKMNKELQEIANSQGATLPVELDKKHQELCQKLSSVKGVEFDKAFAKDMIAGHEKAISRFERETKTGQDTSVKAWAERWLPSLRAHLELARTAAKEIQSSR